MATLIGAIGAWKLRKHPFLIPIPTVVANTLIVPMVLAFFYGAEESYPYLALTVGIGEFVSAYILGLILYRAMRPMVKRLK